MHVAGIAKLNSTKSSFGNGELMETTKDRATIEIVLCNTRFAKTFGVRRNNIGKGGNEDSRLSLPVQGLRMCGNRTGAPYEKQNDDGRQYSLWIELAPTS